MKRGFIYSIDGVFAIVLFMLFIAYFSTVGESAGAPFYKYTLTKAAGDLSILYGGQGPYCLAKDFESNKACQDKYMELLQRYGQKYVIIDKVVAGTYSVVDLGDDDKPRIRTLTEAAVNNMLAVMELKQFGHTRTIVQLGGNENIQSNEVKTLFGNMIVNKLCGEGGVNDFCKRVCTRIERTSNEGCTAVEIGNVVNLKAGFSDSEQRSLIDQQTKRMYYPAIKEYEVYVQSK